MATSLQPSPDQLREVLEQGIDDPLSFVHLSWPWGLEGSALQDYDGPDTWQKEELEAIGRAAKAGVTLRRAVASGHGIGKSALASWIILWYLVCHEQPQVVVTANTTAQLSTKTWRELAKWLRLSIYAGMFTWTATKVYHNAYPATWFAAAVPWRADRPEAFAGTHEKSVLLMFDEASSIDDPIWETAEGAMTSPGSLWVAFGNPTRNQGRFKECFVGGRFQHRWETSQVDSRTAKMTDKGQLEEWIADYGLQSDFVRVRVLGQFPQQAVGQFIGEQVILEAYSRMAAVDPLQPTIVGVDVARFGDDRSVILVRTGGTIAQVDIYREIDTVRLAGYVCEVAGAWSHSQPTLCIDGVGVGAGVVDVCRARGFRVEEVINGAKPMDTLHYENLRAESWDNMRKWLTSRASLDQRASYAAELKADLTGPEYAYDPQARLQLERKAHMKQRGLASPDLADALALTFAVPVAPKHMPPAPLGPPIPSGLPPELAWMAA